MSKKVKESHSWKNVREEELLEYKRHFVFNTNPYLYHVMFPEFFAPCAYKSHTLPASRLVNIRKTGSYASCGTVTGFVCPEVCLQNAVNPKLFALGTGKTVDNFPIKVEWEKKVALKLISCYVKLTFKTPTSYQYIIQERDVTIQNPEISFESDHKTGFSRTFIIRLDKLDSKNGYSSTLFSIYNLDPQTIFYEFEVSLMVASSNLSFGGELRTYPKDIVTDETQDKMFKKLKTIQQQFFSTRPLTIQQSHMIVTEELFALAKYIYEVKQSQENDNTINDQKIVQRSVYFDTTFQDHCNQLYNQPDAKMPAAEPTRDNKQEKAKLGNMQESQSGL